MIGSDPSDLDEMYRIAADRRRRAVIGILLRSRNEMPLDELVSRIVERESETDAPRARTADAVETELVHVHLPMFCEAGLVEFDRDRGVLEPRERIERFDELLPDRVVDDCR